jgi:hypothetical protein
VKSFVHGFAGMLAAVVLIGAIATAASGSRADPSDPSSLVTASSSPTAESGESAAPETERPEAKSEDRPGEHDFTACEGLTGLDNAICRHTALLEVTPKNTGLTNALAHLQANVDRHAAPRSHAGS